MEVQEKHVCLQTGVNDQRPKLMVQMSGVDIKYLVDIGADVSMLSKNS